VQSIPVQSVESRITEITTTGPWDGFYDGISQIERRKNTIIALHRVAKETHEDEQAQKIIDADLDDEVVSCYLERFREGFDQRSTTLDVLRKYGWIERIREESPEDSKTLYYTPNYPKENFTTEYSEHRGRDFENAGESFADGVCEEVLEIVEEVFEERSLSGVRELSEAIRRITENQSDPSIQAIILRRARLKSDLTDDDEYSTVDDSTDDGPVGYYSEIPVYRESCGEFDALLITETESPVMTEYSYSESSIEAEIVELTEDNLEDHLSDPTDLSDEKRREWLQRVILRGKYRFDSNDIAGPIGYRLTRSHNTG